MAESEPRKTGDSDQDAAKAETGSGANLIRMIQEMDARWQKQFEELKRKHESDDSDSEGPSCAKKSKQPDDSADSLSICEEGELEEEEDRLCSSPKPNLVEASEDLLKDIENDFDDDERLGENLRDDLAKITNGRFSKKLGDDNLNKRMEARKRPANCPALVVPTVNQEIWRQLPAQARRADLKVVRTQRAIVKAAIAVAEVVNAILPLGDQKENVRRCADAIAMLGTASQEISLRRRSAMKPHVNKSVARMCDESSGVTITDKLFGDNLTTTLKDMREMDRLGAGPSTEHFKRSSYSNSQKGKGGPFLGAANQTFYPSQRQAYKKGQGKRHFQFGHKGRQNRPQTQ